MRFRELISHTITEAKRLPKGVVPFRTSSEADSHIKQFISQLSLDTGVKETDIYHALAAEATKLEEISKHSPLLYATLSQNIAEQAAFELIKSSVPLQDRGNSPPQSVKFNRKIFTALINRVQYENPGFFALEDPGPQKFKVIPYIVPILVPSEKPQYKQFNNVDTAACTANGEFIFNVPFMEQLLYYGAAIDIKPQGKKYQANGGSFPNNYCYLEFLIMHEVFHYAWGDFITGSQLPQYSSTAHNWAMDFRSNYDLVRMGFTQLPIGLFSDDLNLDRDEFPQYSDLIRVVDEELKKIPRQHQAWLERKFESDAHESDQHEQNEWVPTVGEIVIHNKEGTFGRIVKITSDGQYETVPVSLDEVRKIYPEIKVR
jgi:hypothetical protein